jgi:beta-xylosidase
LLLAYAAFLFTHHTSSLTVRQNSGGVIGIAPYESGPVIKANFPDPCIINVNDTWWAFSTNSGGINIQVASSPDFQTWTLHAGQDALPTPPAWVNMSAPNTWAPDVNLLDNGTYIMYFSATTTQDYTKHCIGAAYSDVVQGPYTALADVLYCPLAEGGAVDASGFKDPNSGDHYVTYKVDGNSIGHGNANGTGECGNTIPPIVPTPIILQPVEADGVTSAGAATTILNNDGLVDQGVIEAPSLVKTTSGEYVLFFSSGCFDGDNYTVSYATSGSVTGPYTRQGVLFETGIDNLVSPGGADVYLDCEHMLFHGDYPDINTRALYTAVI